MKFNQLVAIAKDVRKVHRCFLPSANYHFVRLCERSEAIQVAFVLHSRQ